MLVSGLFVVSLIGTVVDFVRETFEPTITYVPHEENLAHKDENGEVVIENSQLYYEDICKYEPMQIDKWIKLGRYNLSPEELKKENERIAEKYKRLFSY